MSPIGSLETPSNAERTKLIPDSVQSGSRRATLSACIIARNEEQRLPECLASVAFCDEIVLVDSGSTDSTRDLARGAGASVIEQPWLGFAVQRNLAIDHATSVWILEVDADERVTAELRDEILRFLASPPARVELGGLPIRDVFLGRALGPASKYPRYRHRLFARGSHRHDEGRTVHEALVPRSEVHPFAGDLVHQLADGWSEAVGDAWRYARLEAGQLDAPWRAADAVRGGLLRPCAKFAYRVTVDGAWRDGWRGLVRVALDCGTDTVVWTRRLTGWRGAVRGRSGVPAGGHYGARQRRDGSIRVVAVAAGVADARRAVGWASVARAAGTDVVVVTEAPVSANGTRVRPIARARPIALIRALDAEEQLRPVDAVLGFGAHAQRLLRAIPPALRGGTGTVAGEPELGELARAVEAARAFAGASSP